MTVALFIQAVATAFPILLISRLVFGIGFGAIWTAGLAWLAEAVPGGSSLGGSVASAGVGGVLGPALSGVLVQHLGLTIPFLAAATASAVSTAALALLKMPACSSAPSAAVGASLRAAAADSGTICAAAAIVTAGITTGVSSLLVPERLHASGASAGTIGLAFSVAGIFFVAGSILTAATGRRAVRMAVAFAGMLALAIAVTPSALSPEPLAVITMLCATTAARAVLWTVSYPLGAAAAQRSGAGLGAAMGLLNALWVAAALLSPLLAGLAVEHVSPQAVFGLTEAACVAVLIAAVLAACLPRRPQAEDVEPVGSAPPTRTRT
jgi:MFS family permease